MTASVTVLAVLLAVAQLVLPRRFAFLPLLIAAMHLGNVEFLPQLTPIRLVLIAGLLRAVALGHLRGCRFTSLDGIIVAMTCIALISTVGHKADEYFTSPFLYRVGFMFNIAGTYFYARAYLPDRDAVLRLASLLPVLLVPLAIGMTLEKQTRQNLYYPLGARSPTALMRDGKIRAQGPFQHPILAGTCGATALPFAIMLWHRRKRLAAVAGAGSAFACVLACTSSGPLAAVAVSFGVVFGWRFRRYMHLFIWGAIGVAVLYTITRGRGPWFLMASLDLVGGSTGWHRAELIDQAFKYLGEWWLFGTDYTRHWMASGTRSNPNMVDLTNYYIHIGVIGGLGLTLSVVALIITSFRKLWRRMLELRRVGHADEYILWCAAGSLAAHAISFISISYFDQMYALFYLLVGAVPALAASRALPGASAGRAGTPGPQRAPSRIDPAARPIPV